MKNALVFIDYSYNRYSIAVLTGVLEEDERFSELDIHFVKARKQKAYNKSVNSALEESILELTEKYTYLVVAFSFHTPNVIAMGHTITSLRKVLEQNKQSNVLIIAGGPHPSGDPIGTLKMGADVVVIGEGEVVLPNLLEAYFTDQNYYKVKGLAFLDTDGECHFTGKPKPIDLSDYPPFAVKHKRFAPIEIGRGCPWACKFCQTPFLMGGRMRYRSLESIMKYAELAKGSGFRDLRFITPVAFAYGSVDGRTVNLEVLEELLQATEKLFDKEHVYFGSFPSEVRPESVSPETLGLIKRYCANDNIIIGAQSGSERMLKNIHRGHGVGEVIQATKLILEFGFKANVDFIFGMPGETKEDIVATISLMKQLTQMGARVHSHTFMPLVGTPLSQASPGLVDEDTRVMLEALQGQGLAYGHWKEQEAIAFETTSFLKNIAGT